MMDALYNKRTLIGYFDISVKCSLTQSIFPFDVLSLPSPHHGTITEAFSSITNRSRIYALCHGKRYPAAANIDPITERLTLMRPEVDRRPCERGENASHP
jgi:hypothetical protein